MQKQTVLDRIEIDREGRVFFRLALVVMDGEDELSKKWHRSVLPDDAALHDAQGEMVSGHVERMGYPALSAKDIARLKKHAALAT